ncbi:MAG: hypothetical protein EB116_03630 [Betaproteobacteria bacterium]|nr:hypothetical protein [Betaproteobacteria bacterium]
MESLDIWLGGQRAGMLHRAGDALSFVYDAGYIRSPGATPLSLSLPLNRVSHHPDTVSAFFQALLPEPGPTLARLEMSAGVLRSDVLGLLTHVGRDLPGAIQALPSGFEPDEHGDATMLTGDDLAERVHQLRIESASGGRVLAEHGLNTRDHPLRHFFCFRICIPTKLKVDAPNFIGLSMQQDRLVPMKGRVKPKPALCREISLHDHVGDQESVGKHLAFNV